MSRQRVAAVEGGVVAQAGELRSARLESVRALAALGVLVGHDFASYHGFGPATTHGFFNRALYGGGVGVFLFFALTGYLLYWPFARRDFLAGAAVNIRTYSLNRVLRIVPLYVVVVVATLAIVKDGGHAEWWWRFLTLSENFSPDTAGQVIGALWSVVVEIHFYILLPLLALALARLSRGRPAVAGGLLAALGAVSLVLWLWKVDRPHIALGPFAHAAPNDPLWRYNLPATFFYFVGGMMLALVRVHIERHGRPRVLDGPLGRASAWFAAAVALLLLDFQDLHWNPVMTVVGFLVVGACVLPLRPSPLHAVLSWRPLALVGVISYSIYAWQGPIIEELYGTSLPKGVVFVAVLVGVIGFSALSYRVVEAPFLRLRRRWADTSPAAPAPPAVAPNPSS